MLKILHVYRTCFPISHGGLEQVIRYITKGCNEYGVESKILSLSDKDEIITNEGVEITLCKRDFSIGSNCFSISFFRKAKKLIDWADIVHFHYPWPTGDLLSLFVKTKPMVVTYHSDIVRQYWLKKLYKPLESHFLNRVDKIIVTSENYLNSSDNLKIYKNKCEVIPLAIDSGDYDFIDNKILDEYQNKFGDNFFLFVGVLRYYKGLKYLIDAAAMNGLPVVIAGKGPELANLKKQIKELGLSNVHLLGFVSDDEKNVLLKLCKAFVFPSHVRSEAFGVSLLEALYFSKPIISCEIGTGTSYVNQHEKTGVVIPPQDHISLSNAMKKLSEDDVNKAYSKNAFIRFHEEFTMGLMAQRYFNLYKSILRC